MDKLQVALEKAKQKRAGLAPSDAPEKPQPRRRAPDAKAGHEAAWQALNPFDVPASLLEKHRVVTRVAGPSAVPFDVLRTKVLLQMRQNGWKRLAITSPMPGSGKTTMACNLALGIGRQGELRSILLDTDLRSPSVGTYFETRPEHGISEVFNGEVPFSEQALRIGDNVAVSMALRSEEDPTQLLLAAQTKAVIEEIEAQYKPDLVIFDLPSMLVHDDTRAFLDNVDCALIVIRSNKTRFGEFDKCEREVAEHTNVLGVVLNAYLSKNPALE